MHLDRGYLDSGRDAVLDALDDGGMMVIGPAGSGRSMLLQDLATVEERRGRRVWWCRGRRWGAATAQAELRAATLSIAERLREHPTTVVVDDAHLLDDAELLALAGVAEQREDLGVRVIASRRPLRCGAALAALELALIGSGAGRAVHLAPLKLPAVTAWVAAARRPDDSDTSAEAILASTDGWPELVRAELAASADAPGPLHDLARSRLALLPEPDQDVVAALAFGLAAGSAVLGAATGADPDAVDRAVDHALAEGVLHDRRGPTGAVAAVIRAATPLAHRARIAAAAAGASPDTVATVARHLAALDDVSPAAGVLYETAASAIQRDRPRAALDLLDRAVGAGRPAAELLPARITSAVAAGDARTAISLAASAGGDLPPADRAGIARAVGAAWCQLGRPELAAACYLDAGGAEPEALVALLEAGQVGRAREQAATGSAHLPAAVDAMAEGVLAWLRDDPAGAREALGRSMQLAEMLGGVDAWPDSPHAIAALVAAQLLDTEASERAAAAAVDHAVGGDAYASRHRLVQGWVALRGGRIDDAQAVLDGLPATLSPRDRLLAVGLAVAVTLRTGEPDELVSLQQRAVDARAGAALDPFAADVATELAHLAARVGADPSAVLAPIDQVALAAGDPSTLTVPLAWARLVVAVADDDATAARTAASRLFATSRTPTTAGTAPSTVGEPSHAVLAAAAQSFADVLDGSFDAARVREVAASLAARGLVYEAARLVGAAGLRSPDPSAARLLLADLRRLRTTQVRPGPSGDRVVAALSGREREVAQRVLDGRTHREIGAELFISAKTVEHHVARVRQKLGASTRAELLAAIKEELARP